MRLAALLVLCLPSTAFADDPPVITTAKSGPWSAPGTWVGNAVPGAGSRVVVRAGHAVVYDVKSDAVVRGITVSGSLTFATDKDTVLNVGLVTIQAGDRYVEDGFDCDHAPPADPSKPTVCTDEVNPMCGCDGMTYGNPCMAAMAGVSVRSVGACPSDCRTMGCRAGLTCCTSGRSAGSCYAPGCLACCM